MQFVAPVQREFRRVLAACAIVAAVLLAYAPAARNGFVWDDTALILRDPLIRSWRLIPEGFEHFLFTDATASNFYRPMQRLLYTLEYWAFAARPGPYHIVNVLVHAAAALAFWLAARQLLRRFAHRDSTSETIASCAAVVWALHPIHTAAVSYVAGLADPLAAMFGFAALYLIWRSDTASTRSWWMHTVAGGTCFLCSALSKESGFVFLFLWLAVLCLEKRWRAMLRWSVVAAFVVVSYLSLRLPAEHLPTPQIHTPPPALVRPIIASRAVAEYIGLLVFPRNLYCERDLETHPTGLNDESVRMSAWRELETLAGLAILAALVYWALWARRRDRAAFVCLILAAVAYLPVSGIFPLNASMAEHWIYVPSAFLFLGAGLTSAHLRSRFSLNRVAVPIVCLLVVACATRTFIRNFDWKDERTFFERTISAGGNSPRMLGNLAIVEMNEGHFDVARAHLREALAKEPNEPFVLLGLASLAIRQNDYKAAHEWLDRAARIEFVEPQAQELRVVLANHELGQTDLIRMRLAARTGPPNWSIEKRYVKLLAESGMQAAAISELRGVLQREPYRAESWQLLGELLARAGDRAQAAEALTRAHELDVHLDLRPKAL